MEPFQTFSGLVFPLDRKNVDTDQIIPKQFLKRIERQGFGECLFYNWRFDENGNKREDFPLNDPKYDGAQILVAGDNFGCGSSREHAPWALQDYGFKVVIAPSFADIFHNNCLKNGILTVELPEEEVRDLIDKAQRERLFLTVDLEKQVVLTGEKAIHFDIDPYPKNMLLKGLDEIGLTLLLEDEISKFEASENAGV